MSRLHPLSLLLGMVVGAMLMLWTVPYLLPTCGPSGFIVPRP